MARRRVGVSTEVPGVPHLGPTIRDSGGGQLPRLTLRSINVVELDIGAVARLVACNIQGPARLGVYKHKTAAVGNLQRPVLSRGAVRSVYLNIGTVRRATILSIQGIARRAGSHHVVTATLGDLEFLSIAVVT